MSTIIERELDAPEGILRGTLVSREDVHALVSTVDGETAVFPANEDGSLDVGTIFNLLLSGWEPWAVHPENHEAGITEARDMLGNEVADRFFEQEDNDA
jgi:hypothetical protein